MRSASRISAVALGAALLLAVCAGVARADERTIGAFYEGEIVHVIPLFIQNHPPTQVANPIYFGSGVLPVVGEVPGEAGYSPWWNVTLVIDSDTGLPTVDQFKSEEEILDAAAAGDVKLVTTQTFVLCPVVR